MTRAVYRVMLMVSSAAVAARLEPTGATAPSPCATRFSRSAPQGEGRPPMPFLEPVTLRGTYARLEPLSPAHHDALVEAVQDGELWKLWYTSIAPKPEDMTKEIERRLGLLAAGTMLPFTVFDADGRISGMTTYLHVDAVN